jgi:hypothetical protein
MSRIGSRKRVRSISEAKKKPTEAGGHETKANLRLTFSGIEIEY